MYMPLVERGVLPAPVEYYPAGVPVGYTRPFDICFTRQSNSFMGRNIGLFTNGYWSHAYPVLWTAGFIAEALEWGVEWDRDTKYTNHDVMVIRLSTTLSNEAAWLLADYYEGIANRPWSEREKYGYWHIVSLALFLTGQGFRENILGMSPRKGRAPVFGEPDQIICSGYVAEGLEQIGYGHPQVPVRWIWPNELAKDLGGETNERILRERGFIKG